jgi:hypothetical protein
VKIIFFLVCLKQCNIKYEKRNKQSKKERKIITELIAFIPSYPASFYSYLKIDFFPLLHTLSGSGSYMYFIYSCSGGGITKTVPLSHHVLCCVMWVARVG